MAETSRDLHQIRDEIDALDAEIQALITRRAVLAQEVAAVKRVAGETRNFYRPEREQAVLRQVQARNQGPLPDEAMLRLFREIMASSLALQQPLKIAVLGPAGTFSQEAAHKHFGQAVTVVLLAAIDEVFREVEAGTADYGVVPVENSTEGSVSLTLDMLIRSPLRICGEVDLRIRQNLLARTEDLHAIGTVFAHQQSLAQCREWLDARLPQARRVAVNSNAEGARRAIEQADAAAIASRTAAQIYGLRVLQESIEDEPNNTTRFAVIGPRAVDRTGADKTSLLLALDNRPGALFGMLEPFARHGLDMTRIESRPARNGAWDYWFFIDVLGHHSEPPMQAAMAELRRAATLFRMLGSYPRGLA